MTGKPGNGAVSAIRVVDLHKSFGALEVLKGISFEVAHGEVVCLIGVSGSGKSTLLRCINFLETPNAGRIYIDGKLIGMQENPDGGLAPADPQTLAAQRAQIGFVFQLFNLWPHRTVLGNVIDALMVVKKLPRLQAREIGMASLSKVGLSDKWNEYPTTLSGGQQQRVAIARSLAMQPRILLFDEPTSSLDPELVGEVISVMKQLAEEGHTMVVATHEMGFARDTANQVIFIDNGVIEEAAAPSLLFTAPEKERTRAFLNRALRENP